MDRSRVEDAIALLDREVPKDGARMCLEVYGGGPDEGRMIGNEAGYLRFGLEIMKGAFAPIEKESSAAIKVDLQGLVTSDSSIGFDWFERREPEAEPASHGSPIFGFFAMAILFFLLAMTFAGCVTTLSWLSE